ncbi:MAG: hypothetical protein SNJ68_04195 [Cyanobacteriota bacterium]
MSQPYPPVTSRIFPRSVLSMSRREFGDGVACAKRIQIDNPNASGDPLWLQFTPDSPQKELPADLWGSVYMVGPVGSVDSPAAPGNPGLVDPTRDGTILLYNGDGMIYRFDLSEPSQGIRLTTRLADTPDYIVSRRDLKPGIPQVQARKVMIPWESAHFLVNYKNPGGKIFVHFSYVCAWDAGETVSKFDYEKQRKAPSFQPGDISAQAEFIQQQK